MSGEIHRSKVGTYHPAPCMSKPCFIDPEHAEATYPHCVCQHAEPCDGVAWTIHDTRGTIDGGSACDECGACECGPCNCKIDRNHDAPLCKCPATSEKIECIGLSFAYICLDGGEVLCEECAAKEGITIMECDCE